jgi:hypothetical protein
MAWSCGWKHVSGIAIGVGASLVVPRGKFSRVQDSYEVVIDSLTKKVPAAIQLSLTNLQASGDNG